MHRMHVMKANRIKLVAVASAEIKIDKLNSTKKEERDIYLNKNNQS